MSKSQVLRALVNERLAVAAEEIFVLFERMIVEYEEELCRCKEKNERKQQLLDHGLSSRVDLIRGNVHIPPTSPGPSLNQEITDTPWIKEEPEEESIKQEQEQLPESVPEFDVVCVKTEETALLEETQGEDFSSEPHFHSETEGHSENSSDTDNNDDWVRPISFSAAQMETEADGDHYNQSNSAPETTVQSGHTSGSDGADVEEIHQCTVCKRTFGSKLDLRTHVKVHIGEGSYSCSICEKTFSRHGHLNIHLRTHTGERPYACAHCNRSFAYKTALKLHERTHTGEKPYSCTVCNKTFAQKGHLELHIRTHTGEKPYSCTICEKKFAQKGDLSKHTRTHTGEKPYSCSVCDKNFSQKGNLKSHMLTHMVSTAVLQ